MRPVCGLPELESAVLKFRSNTSLDEDDGDHFCKQRHASACRCVITPCMQEKLVECQISSHFITVHKIMSRVLLKADDRGLRC